MPRKNCPLGNWTYKVATTSSSRLSSAIDEYYSLAEYIVTARDEMLKAAAEAKKEGKEYKCPEGMAEAICAYTEEEERSIKAIEKEAKKNARKMKKNTDGKAN